MARAVGVVRHESKHAILSYCVCSLQEVFEMNSRHCAAVAASMNVLSDVLFLTIGDIIGQFGLSYEIK